MRESTLTRSLPVILLAALAVGPGPCPAVALAQPQGATPQPPVFGAQTAAVVVDVVVRDKKGKLVRDLSAAEFTVLEDGAPQTVDSLRVVDTAPAAEEDAGATASSPAAPHVGTAAPAAGPKAAPARAPSLIAFRFDRLSPDARKTAEKAALSYTDRGHMEGDLVAVFAIDLALRTLQPFTNDVQAVKAALSRAATQGNTAFASERADARERTDSVARADDSLGALTGPGNQAAASLVAAQRRSTRSRSTCCAPSTRSSATSRDTPPPTAFWPWSM